MMKRTVALLMVLFIGSIGLMGCGGGGGGGGGDTGTPTPTGTPVSIATVKGVYYGTATPGTQISFNLTGSDSQGASYTGSFTIVSDGPTTFESQDVTESRFLVTLQQGTGTPITDITSNYFLTSNSTLYKSVSSLGITTIPISQTVLPDTIDVGDFAVLLEASNSDGTTETTTWRLDPDVNGNSQFILSSVEKTGTTVTATEDDTFYLDPSGNPFKMKVSVTESGFTLNLAGDRT